MCIDLIKPTSKHLTLQTAPHTYHRLPVMGSVCFRVMLDRQRGWGVNSVMLQCCYLSLFIWPVTVSDRKQTMQGHLTAHRDIIYLCNINTHRHRVTKVHTQTRMNVHTHALSFRSDMQHCLVKICIGPFPHYFEQDLFTPTVDSSCDTTS